MKSLVPFLSSFVLLFSCVSSREGDRIRDDVFQLQSRLEEMETQMNQKASKKQGEAANQRIANTGARLDSIEGDLRGIHGDLDVLRIALKTGEIPGSNPEEESLGKRLQSIQERLAACEEAQRLMLERLTNKKAPGAQAQGKKSLKNFKDLEQAFIKKNHQAICQEGPLILDRLPKGEQPMARYYYGESLFLTKKYSDAALTFNAIIKEPSLKEKVPEIQFKLGYSFEALGEKDVAQVYYNELIQKFPKSHQAEAARNQISHWKAPTAPRK
jgi:TolA-binding protein